MRSGRVLAGLVMSGTKTVIENEMSTMMAIGITTGSLALVHLQDSPPPLQHPHTTAQPPQDGDEEEVAGAVVPPAVLLVATHGVALLVRARTAGWAYGCAWAMTVALAGCAFGLSFDALRDLTRRYAGYSDWKSYQVAAVD